jgi:hypothetical protein
MYSLLAFWIGGGGSAKAQIACSYNLVDYQATLYAPVYNTFGQCAVLTTNGNKDFVFTAVNKTAISPFLGVGVEYQSFKPSARLRMADVIHYDITPKTDLVGGQLMLDGKAWSIKSFEFHPSPVGVNDGELQLILKDDLFVGSA